MDQIYDRHAPPAAGEPRRPRFAAPGHVRGGARLPAPGQVIDLEAPPTPADTEDAPAASPTPNVTPVREQAVNTVPESTDAPTKESNEEQPDAEQQPLPTIPDGREQADHGADQPPPAQPDSRYEDALDRIINRIDTWDEAAVEEQRAWWHSLRPHRRWGIRWAAAAACGYLPVLVTHDLSTAIPHIVRDAVTHAGAPPYHWTTGLAAGCIITLAGWAITRAITNRIAALLTSRAPQRAEPVAAALAWIATIPPASAGLGVLLWGPAWQQLAF